MQTQTSENYHSVELEAALIFESILSVSLKSESCYDMLILYTYKQQIRKYFYYIKKVDD